MTSLESFLVPKTKKAVKVCSMSEWDQPLQVQIANKIGVKQSPGPEIFSQFGEVSSPINRF